MKSSQFDDPKFVADVMSKSKEFRAEESGKIYMVLLFVRAYMEENNATIDDVIQEFDRTMAKKPKK